MSNHYLAKCRDCGNEFLIGSPATMVCQKCGCGTLVFEQKMRFKCFKGHEYISEVSNPQCDKCYGDKRNVYRTFEPETPITRVKEAVKKVAHVGDKGNTFPEVKSINKPIIKKRRKKK